jgi:hypothetical protein
VRTGTVEARFLMRVPNWKVAAPLLLARADKEDISGMEMCGGVSIVPAERRDRGVVRLGN